MPFDLFQSSFDWHALGCKGKNCGVGINGNSIFYNPELKSTTYHPQYRKVVEAMVEVPKNFPEANSRYIGAPPKDF